MSEVEVFRRAESIIAESIWCSDDGAVNWLDIDTGVLRRSRIGDPVDGSADRTVGVPPPASAFQPTRSGGLVVALQDRIVVTGWGGEAPTELARIDHAHPRIRLNEGKCDPFGCFVVGSQELRPSSVDAALYRIHPDGSVDVLLGGLGVSNGFEWSDDGDRMWFADTAIDTIYTGRYGPDGISDVEPFIVGRASDGFTRDADGGFWSGIYDTGSVVHWSVDGRLVEEIDTPAAHVTSVGFAGADLSTLFIGSARENLTESQLEDAPLTGSIFALPTTTRGLPVRVFDL